jgi:DNA repair protein RadD
MELFLNQFINVKIIGLTATPVILVPGLAGSVLKMINRCRKSIWNHVIHIVQIADIIKAGYWSKLVYDKVDVDDDMLRYNTNMSEYTDESIEKMYEVNDLGTMVKKKIETLTDRKHILVFCPSIITAQQLAAKISGAEVVHSNMSKEERDGVIMRFRTGVTRIVINVLILSVGFDFPELDCVIDTVPTASIGRYYQKIGRVTRLHLNKLFALIVDFSSNYERFGELSDLNFEDVPDYPIKGWGMFSKDRLLTGVGPLDDPIYKNLPKQVVKLSDETKIIEVVKEYVFTFGRYKDQPISKVPKWYLEWMSREFTFRRNDPLENIVKHYLNK